MRDSNFETHKMRGARTAVCLLVLCGSIRSLFSQTEKAEADPGLWDKGGVHHTWHRSLPVLVGITLTVSLSMLSSVD